MDNFGYCTGSLFQTSDRMELPITRCCFNHTGHIFAYAVSYDWSKVSEIGKQYYGLFIRVFSSVQGHEFSSPSQRNCIFLHNCFEELKPRPKNK